MTTQTPPQVALSQSTNFTAIGKNGALTASKFKASRAQQYLLTGLPILLCDLFTFLVCFSFAISCAGFFLVEPVSYKWIGIVLCVHMVACFLIMELYDGVGMHPVYEFRQTTLCLSLLFILVTSHLMINQDYAAIAAVICFPLMVVGIPVTRSLVRSFLGKSSWWGIRAIVFSAGRRVERLYRAHLKNVDLGVRPVGFMQQDVPEKLSDDLRAHYLGNISDAGLQSEELNAYCAIVHRYGRTDREIFEFVEQNLSMFSRVLVHPDDPRLPSLWLINRNGSLSFEDRLMQPTSQFTKRAMDLIIAGTAMVVFAPVMIGIILWIKITSPGPVFFGHERIGKNGRRFKAWKFRSMVTNGDEILAKCLAENPEMKAEWDATYKLKKDPRITPPGRFIRKTSLDELPQLWNVLKGEMSLVGPRPIVEGEVERYKDAFKSYQRVIPGVTGLWQVSGRNLTTYDRRVELDEFYVRNWSAWFDLYILGRTIKTVLFREGAF